MDVPAELEPLWYVSFILCGMVFCERCSAEAEYTSAHPDFTDESYIDCARAMLKAGWTVVPEDALAVLCPGCSGRQAGPQPTRSIFDRLWAWVGVGRGSGPHGAHPSSVVAAA